MAERLLCKQIVVGSIPAASTKRQTLTTGSAGFHGQRLTGDKSPRQEIDVSWPEALRQRRSRKQQFILGREARNSAFISPESREAFRRDRLRRAAGAERAPLAKGGGGRGCVRPGPGRLSTAAVSNERAKESSATDGCLGNARRRRTRQSAKIAAEPTRGDEAAASEWGNPPADAGIGFKPRRTRRTEPSQ